MTITIERLDLTDAGLRIFWRGEPVPTFFSWFWLRDHGQDPDSLDQDTLQRKIDTFGISADIVADRAEITPDGTALTLAWHGGAESSYPTMFLARAAGVLPADDTVAPTLWARGNDLDARPQVRFDEVMANDAGVRTWLEQIARYGFCVVVGVPPNAEAARKLAERIGYLRDTIFGDLWQLSSEVTGHSDTAYTTQFLEPHTDATYCHDAPGLQMFTCLEFDGEGGESILVDGLAQAEQLRQADPAAFATLTRVTIPGRYIEPGVHLRTERPALRLDAAGRVVQVSFNNYDRAPFLLPEPEMTAFYRAYGLLHARIADPANSILIPLRPGMTLIFDNWRLLHGRAGYRGRRVFCGCYHNREDFESRLRVLREAVKPTDLPSHQPG